MRSAAIRPFIGTISPKARRSGISWSEPVGAMLDVGAGSGVFSRMLMESGEVERATCVDPNYEDRHLGEQDEGRLSFVRTATAEAVDAVMMIDVLEHVDDDLALIKQYSDTAKPGTRFVFSVPAFNFLWSSHDEYLEHRRRYTLEALEKTVRAAGLTVDKTQYFFGLLFPAVATLRLADRAMKGDKEAEQSALKAAPAWLNKTLIALHDVERATLAPFNKLAGVTAFCLAKKPALAESRDAA